MATFYFSDVVGAASSDGDWNNIDNWWLNAARTTAAGGRPTSSDSVVIDTDSGNGILTNSGSDPTIVNLTIDAASNFKGITVTATGAVTVNSTQIALFGSAVINGNCTFTGFGILNTGGVINGNCTFTGSNTQILGIINGNVTATGATIDGGSANITGDVVMNGAAKILNGAQINGNATFNGTSECYGSISGNATFNGTSALKGDPWSFGTGSVSGSATFRDSATMTDSCSVYGNATFYNNTAMIGGGQFGYRPYVGATARFYDNSYCDWPSFSGSAAEFYDNSVNKTGFSSVTAKHGRGINGSSILGIA